MIEARGLTKNFGSVVAVRDVSFCIKARTVAGLLGPNGAGKSTTLRMLAGVLGPDSGSISIAGHDIVQFPIAARANLGYLAETSPLYPEMRVTDYLRYRAALKGIKRSSRVSAARDAARDAHCDDVSDVTISQLSRGYRQRVGLADALLTRPAVLLLDEPTAGLDPNQIREVRDLIATLAHEHTILLSTHVLAEVEACCSEAVIIHRGELIAHDSLDQLRERRHGRQIILRVRDPESKTLAIAQEQGWAPATVDLPRPLRSPSTEPDVHEHVLFSELADANPDLRLETLVTRLVQGGIGVRSVHGAPASLEAVFAELTQSLEVT